ncbi:MAG: PDZ domain-containing protein [Clostridiaceae bacterium]|jgi:stage IV sporulation protein B|nr:PDZ domain-containing protein [Clostridiaceae bacterium]
MSKKLLFAVFAAALCCSLLAGGATGSATEGSVGFSGGAYEMSEDADATGILEKLKSLFGGSYNKINYEGEEVYLGGTPLGIEMNREGLEITSVTEVITDKGAELPLRNCGVLPGDVLLSVNGVKIMSVSDIRKALDGNPGTAVTLKISRGDTKFECNAVPAKDALTGKMMLGIQVQSDINGIGTLTFIRKNGRYGALGHMISSDGGDLSAGVIYPAVINGVKKGEKGATGALMGTFSKSKALGSVDTNSGFGLYGNYTALKSADDGANTVGLPSVKVAGRGSVTAGKAYIYTTISGDTPKFYEIQIVKASQQNTPAEKGLVLSVTDERLKNISGGIVQGMSGSPIVQNDRLVGAVTHVFTNDPLKGFGIYAEWMLATSDINASVKSNYFLAANLPVAA